MIHIKNKYIYKDKCTVNTVKKKKKTNTTDLSIIFDSYHS